MKTFKTLSHCVYSCHYHVVWCSKYRRKVLTPSVSARLKVLLDIKAVDLGCKIIEIEVMEDHVHLLLDIPPNEAVGVVVGRLKGYASKILRSEFAELKSRLPTLWTNSYFAASTGGAPLEKIKEYIKNQKTK